MKEFIASTLKQLRSTKGYSAEYVVEELKRNGTKLSTVTLYGYENGVSQPKADMFLQICKIYGVKDFSIFFENEVSQNINNHYDNLNTDGKAKADEYIEDLYGNPKYTQKTKSTETSTSDFDNAPVFNTTDTKTKSIKS